MIFLTVGSEIAFDRLVQAVDEWCGINGRIDVFGQIAEPGPGGYWPVNFEWKDFLTPEDYCSRYDEAELIISHAGMGSIITAMMQAKPILIMPRLADLRETRNNHQVATAKRFSERKGIFVAKDETLVSPMLNKWNKLRETIELEPMGPYAEDRLIETIRDFIVNNNGTKS